MSLRAKLRNYLRWRRHHYRLALLRRTHPLKYLFMEVTRQCNLACAYCGSSCTGRAPDGELTSEEWVGIIRQVGAEFRPKEIMVAVTGGEPLIKPGIFDIMGELRKQGFPYGMVSNGQILDKAAAKELVRVGIGSISLSMDGLPEINDSLRGKGCSKGVETAIANLREAGYSGKLEIISTLTKPAIQTLDQMRRYLASMQIRLWRAAPVMPIGRAAEHPELIPDSVDVRALLEYIRISRSDGMLPRPEFSEEGFLGYRFEGIVRPYLSQCRAGITVAGIRANGRVGACPELNPVFDQGDIRKENLKEIWDNRYQVFRDRSWTKNGKCGECDKYAHCNGGALHLYDSPETPFLRCLYLMCRETDDKYVPAIPRTPPANSPGA